MGNNSTKLSNKNIKKSHKDKTSPGCCCLCSSSSLTNSLTSSSCSIDDKYFPTVDRILSKKNNSLVSGKRNEISSKDKNRTNYSQPIPHVEKPFLNTTNINQWIDSLPIHDTKLLNPSTVCPLGLTRQNSLTNDDEQLSRILAIKSNREFLNLIKQFQLNFYLEDYRKRIKNSALNQTFKTHFSSSAIINSSNRVNQSFIDDLNLFITSPPESILPNFIKHTDSSYKIHEQIRSKYYAIPLTTCQIEPDDDEYKQKSIPVDRTHVVITLDNTSTTQTNKMPMEYESSCMFTSNNSFQTGLIYVNQEKISKDLQPFISCDSEENVSYLSANFIQTWFNTLILVNQTCNIVQQFLAGNEHQFTCLLKEQMENQSEKEKRTPYSNNLVFASLRLPPCKYLNDDLSSTDVREENCDKIIDTFSPLFSSDNKKLSNDSIHVDYEQYSFAFALYRWPKSIIDNYYTHSNRSSKRQWPSQYSMNSIIKKPLLLTPDSTNDIWKINFDLIEANLFELMNESTLFFYILCQQLFSQTCSIRIIIKHCFLNYCEKYGLPFSSNQNNISDLLNLFLQELSEKVNENFFPNYFNHEINLLNPNENYNQWFDYINKYVHNGIDISFYSSLSSTLTIVSNRSIIIEFLFHFIKQLYQTLHVKQSQFYLNDNALLDLHKEICEKLSNDNQKSPPQTFINDLLNNEEILTHIQANLTYDFEKNAELVHSCLNQIRKSQTSLVFHYTWTIFIQYLHTYYNVLWNI
ncbi:unnamed protein product [Rotaria socialis]|uniref:Uncharacterized protein n=3 Tax=Rotaria socialis TaxID=392032 RepID=A0A818F002_9BILA|nr:unnamed protein product [Rotaria socialis]CAF3337305.1 unnamed protein product [Rotaria socialis]CAF3467187.1 unnamed protein product [Rotaria socialis]CAF3509085.1 unnamed protein product [Rotaria socialis]CAF4090762.1 unnamed protein product [Rotaria socialis]